jgi:hypothetical protein
MVEFAAELNACDLLEVVRDFTPRIQTVPFGFPSFVSGGGRGERGPQGPLGNGGAGVQGPQGPFGGPQGFQGVQGPQGTDGGWTDDGTIVRLTTVTDNVGIGTAAPGSCKLAVFGDVTTEVTLCVRAVAAQTADILQLQDSTGAVQLAFSANNRLALRGVTPLFLVHGQGQDAVDGGADVTMDTYSDTVASDYLGRRARGTIALPADVMSGDRLVSLSGRGRGGGAFSVVGRGAMRVDASEAWTGVAQGARIMFETTPNGGTATAEMMRLTDGGSVIIGSPFALIGSERLRVNGDARVDGKLTVTGAIDPTSVLLSSGTALFFESNNGNTAPVSGAATGRIRYNNATGTWQVSTQAAAYVDIATGAASGWADDGTVVRLTTASDNVGIGTAAPGAHKTLILGDVTTEVTLGLRAVAAQSVDMAQYQNSIGLVFASVSAAGLFSVFAIAGDANPVIDVGQTSSVGRIRFGAGGGSAPDVRIRRSGALQLTIDNDGGGLGITVLPSADQLLTLGSNSLRLTTIACNNFNVFGAAGDANVRSALVAGALFFGPGGASAIDVSFARTAAATVRLDNGSGGAASFLPGADAVGDIGNATNRWSLVRAVTITPGDLVFENGWRITEEGQDGLKILDPEGREVLSLTRNALCHHGQGPAATEKKRGLLGFLFRR